MCAGGLGEEGEGHVGFMGGRRRGLMFMSASTMCGACVVFVFGPGGMNEGVDGNGVVEVCVVRLRVREGVAVIGWLCGGFGSE